jgi:hypothetical protein
MFWKRNAVPPPPKIICDPQARCAADIASGMAVEIVDFELYVQERNLLYKLYWRNEIIDFKGGYDFDESRIFAENLTSDAGQLASAIWEASTVNIFVKYHSAFRKKKLLRGDGIHRIVLLVLKSASLVFPYKKIVTVSDWTSKSLSPIKGNCSAPLSHAGAGMGLRASVRRMASMARSPRRRAVSTTERMSA